MTTGTADNEVRKQAAHWAERLMQDDLAAVEREEFQRWLMASEQHQREFRAHTLIANLACDLPNESRDELLELAIKDTSERSLPRKAWITGLAASVLLAVAVAGWFVYRSDASTHVTTAGMTRDVALPDGSMAYLNTRTDLRWIGRADERRVALLEGEALFEVRHDATKPFTVVLDASEIRVLGTRFNVRRRENAEIVVTVLEGSVSIAQGAASGSAQEPWSRTLRADEQIVYGAAGLIRDVHSAAGANAARWREGILEFEDEPLANIVADLGRYTDLKIQVRDPRVAQLRLGGQLNVHDRIEDSLGLLEKLAPVATHRSGDTFVLDFRQGTAEETH